MSPWVRREARSTSPIEAGHVSTDMDDKWNAFVEGTRLFLHRSWTGRGIYEASFAEADGGWRIAEAVVESDPASNNRHGDDAESLCLELTIESVRGGRS